ADCSPQSSTARNTTTYELDAFANRTAKTVTTDDGDQRKTKQEFDALCRYVDIKKVYVDGGFEISDWVKARDHFGNPTYVVTGQGVDSHAVFDSGDRKSVV